MQAEFSNLLQLSVAQRLQLVEELWDSIVAVPQSLPVPDWQKDELARRKAEFVRDPQIAVAWEDVKDRIRGQHG